MKDLLFMDMNQTIILIIPFNNNMEVVEKWMQDWEKEQEL